MNDTVFVFVPSAYDVVNLYPSVTVDKAANVLIDILNNSREHLKERTKLIFTDIQKLTELCLSKCYLLYENYLRLFENNGPAGFTLMVGLSECYFQNIECKAIIEDSNYKITPKTFTCFVDDRGLTQINF